MRVFLPVLPASWPGRTALVLVSTLLVCGCAPRGPVATAPARPRVYDLQESLPNQAPFCITLEAPFSNHLACVSVGDVRAFVRSRRLVRFSW